MSLARGGGGPADVVGGNVAVHKKEQVGQHSGAVMGGE